MKRTKIFYGEHPEQFGHLYLPDTAQSGPVPIVMVVHGGSWSGEYGLSMGTQYAVDFARAGLAAWNIEYRRLGAGGHWPETSADMRAALQALRGIAATHTDVDLNVEDIRVLGHSAGGHLAAWLAGERNAEMRPSLVVAQAGVLDLVTGPESGAVNPAVEELLGASYSAEPDLYRSASPHHRLPTSVPFHCIHGDADTLVPVSQSARYVEAVRAAGGHAELTVVAGEDHFAFLSPGSECWKRSVAAVRGGPAEIMGMRSSPGALNSDQDLVPPVAQPTPESRP